MSSSQQPIIKKIKKVSGESHHGGAWKVAYADFVTAMMAFFLLMWLLNATTEDQRKGIADYFNPTIPISQISGGGSDVLNGDTVLADKTLAKNGTGGAKVSQTAKDAQEEAGAEAPPSGGADLENVQDDLNDQFDTMSNAGLAEHIIMKVTPEGLVIELTDVNDRPLFDVGSAKPSPTLKVLLEIVSSSLHLVENDISIVGHTDSLAYSGDGGYTNWELSTDRANIARKLITAAGFPQTRISEVAGKADTEPLVEDQYAPQNRRISITVLRS